jgi:spore coat protein A, manganese oxidase
MSLTRRDVLKTGLFASAALALPLNRVVNAKSALSSRMAASKLPKPFTTPFAAPPVAVPVFQDATTDYYQMTMKAVQAEIVPGFKTTFYSYDGFVPGPTIKVNQGRKTVVRHINGLPSQHSSLKYEPWTSVHLHGSASLPQFDGYASDITRPGQYKDYHYPNFQQARTLWYHDHGVHHTAENAYHGCAAQYHMFDPLEQSLAIPHGEFDVPLVLHDAMFNNDGSLLFTLENQSGLWGDVILVNGRPWPAMKVKRRKYRFRVLDASISRSYNLSLSTGDPFWIIGTDGGLMPAPQQVTSYRQLSGERYEIVIDFSKYKAGQRVILKNTSPKNNINYANADKVMAFDVVADSFDPANNEVPAQLNPNDPVMQLKESDAVKTRQFRFERKGGEWTVNGTTWKTVEDSNFQFVSADPKLGDTEVWEFVNTSGGWFHPVHVHLVDFKILSRNGGPPLPHELGPKDVVYLGEGETVRTIMKFEGRGKYMIHCHNLIHEDHDMMTQFEVVDPNGPGDDPMGTTARSMSDLTPLW